jgi:hypothetical protein
MGTERAEVWDGIRRARSCRPYAGFVARRGLQPAASAKEREHPR